MTIAAFFYLVGLRPVGGGRPSRPRRPATRTRSWKNKQQRPTPRRACCFGPRFLLDPLLLRASPGSPAMSHLFSTRISCHLDGLNFGHFSRVAFRLAALLGCCLSLCCSLRPQSSVALPHSRKCRHDEWSRAGREQTGGIGGQRATAAQQHSARHSDAAAAAAAAAATRVRRSPLDDQSAALAVDQRTAAAFRNRCARRSSSLSSVAAAAGRSTATAAMDATTAATHRAEHQQTAASDAASGSVVVSIIAVAASFDLHWRSDSSQSDPHAASSVRVGV